ncbi:MAG: DHH family phosphoesterase, partial [Clostridiales bacterium]|nr:DHH family phosphoesterase [Clostridiales bacterium]
MHPRLSDLPDPLLLRGMAEARDRVRAAIDNGESILIFGDYDADGICASAILYLYLQSVGAEVNVFIPDRADGYGLSEETVERAAEEFAPDLFITVDCGISCAAEIEYILDLGIDAIVTDHHEPPDVLPDCIVVDPKIKGQDVYCHFCGAGVAFLLAAALGGLKNALQYIDVAAAATVADMVPLTGCNRVLVA